ncbi:nucleoside-triphosphatase [Psychroserpens sp. MEBiC05023]
MIYILSDAIRTGKTTALQEWIKNRDDVDGLLCPDDQNGKRYFLKIKSKETFPLEVGYKNEDLVTIGPFQFLKSAFDSANRYLMTTVAEHRNQHVIIDELGKLELKCQGLHDSATRLIPNYVSDKNQHLIIVVRDTLVNDIVSHYNISEYSIFKKEDLKTIL